MAITRSELRFSFSNVIRQPLNPRQRITLSTQNTKLNSCASQTDLARIIPESILHELRTLSHEIGNELAFGCTMPTSGAREVSVVVSFRKGGKFDSSAAAFRALRNGG